jgi:hypothetical protein|tara:strand:+ start:581 stop:1258 length:678 start_codon:yes stop_codon:yes gene_type:complete
MVKIAFNDKEKFGHVLVPAHHYSVIKNRYCIAYFGPMAEYIIQLNALFPIIEKQFPKLEMYLAIRNELLYLIENRKRVILKSEIPEFKDRIAYFREVKLDFYNHPILKILEESNIKIPKNSFPINKEPSVKCVIVTHGINPPTQSLNEEQIKKLHDMCQAEGYQVEIDSNIENAGWVVGVESPKLYKAGARGIKTSLVPTGIGTKLYKMMFVNGNNGNILQELSS